MPIVLAGPRVSARAFGLGAAMLCTLPMAATAADIDRNSFEIHGVTRDMDKRPVPSVQILIHSVNGSISRSVSSDNEGAFSVLNLSAGVYELTPSKAGFNEAPATMVEIASAGSVPVELTLEQTN